MKNTKTTTPKIWQYFNVNQNDISKYTWVEDPNGKYMIRVQDYSDLKHIKTVRTIRCKSLTKPCHWSWLNKS